MEEVLSRLEVKSPLNNKKNGRERLVITSIPYQVNKSVLNERIAQLVREKKLREEEILEMNRIERV